MEDAATNRRRFAVVGMKEDGPGVNSKMQRIEDTLLRLIEGFARYRSQLMRAYERAQALSSRAAFGFSDSEAAALHRENMDRAVQDYFRLRDQIDHWLEQSRQIIVGIIEAEERSTSTGTPFPDNRKESAPAHHCDLSLEVIDRGDVLAQVRCSLTP